MPLTLPQMHALIADGGANTALDVRDVTTALYDWIPLVEKYKMGRLAGETAHASDDFFTTYSGYTEHEPTGTAVWTATRAGLTCLFEDQATADFAVAVKDVPAAGVPITIETQMTSPFRHADNPMGGLIFTDGTVDASNLAGITPAMISNNALIQRNTGTLGTVVGVNTGVTLREWQGLFWRLIWVSADTFKWGYSHDSVTWFYSATFASTFTPTKMGFTVSSWTDTTPSGWTFAFLRVYEADLSL